MRKAIALLLTLVLFCSVGLGFAHISVNKAKDNVVLTETTLLGDPSAADGLEILTTNDYNNNRLTWETTHITGSEKKTDTIFTFTAEPKRMYYARDYSGLHLETYIHTDLDTNSPYEELDPIEKEYRDLFDATEPGHESKKTIRVADYLDYYPITIEIDLPNYTMYYYFEDDFPDENRANDVYSSMKADIITHYRNFFRIPVLEDEYLDIHVRKGPSHVIGSGSGSSEKGDWYTMFTQAVTTPDAMYFLFDAHTSNTNIIDTSLIPGGFGIYCQPYSQPESEQSKYNSIDPVDLSMVFPLDPEMKPQYFVFDKAKNQLILVTEEYGKAILRILDADDCTLIQSEVIVEFEEGDGIWAMYHGDDYIAFTASGSRLIVFSHANERYVPRINIQMNDNSVSEEILWRILDTDWNGEQFAVVSQVWTQEDFCDFELSIFDASGILYCGEYKSSLTTGYAANSYNYYVHPTDSAPLRVRWIR